MSLTLARIRARVRDSIETLAAGVPSGFAPDQFGRDSRSLAHRAFAVALSSTDASEDDRQTGRGRPRSAYAGTLLVVRTAYLLRTDGIDGDYNAALDAEQEVAAAVLRSAERPAEADALEPMFHVRFRRTSSRETVEGYLVVTSEFLVGHQYDLTLASERT